MAGEPDGSHESWVGGHQKIVEALREMAGKKDLPFLVAEETLWLLDGYASSMSQLPGTVQQAQHYLDYFHIEEPELLPEKMLELFGALKGRASNWFNLRNSSKAVAESLIKLAESIQAQGEEVVSCACETKALGTEPEKWGALNLPEAIEAYDKAIVSKMASSFTVLKTPIQHFQASIEHVQAGLAEFRDEARFKLMPVVQEKMRALNRLQRARQFELSLMEFPQSKSYVHPAASGRACAVLKVNLGKMEAGLSIGVAGVGSIHSLWQGIDAYIDQSEHRLLSMETQEQLANFMVQYRIFLAQWAGIKMFAQEKLLSFEAVQ
ncbi:hypothetical protein [Pseudomonas sp. KU43P]|uniref:hypothetical protein n=1 Tax=Pseudomonas sp. KU43P TaxID=2487887 RepID=UPI0012A941C0|nr:hypothetical protein [Pseudomonas sp. KU43P]BBH47779.1 hypothetical protein KU43P_42560 [Pseudomonas sp. KU43P]